MNVGTTPTKTNGNVRDKITRDSNESWKTKYRISASQIFASFATNVLKFSFGTALGFTIILIAELYKEDSEIKATMSEITWLSSSCFMGLFGSLFLGILAQNIGTRLVMLISMVSLTIAWLIFYHASSIAMLLGAQALIGLTASTSSGSGIAYVAEITQPRLRSPLIATSNLSVVSGSFLTVFLGNLLYWRTIILVNLIFPILGFILIFIIPESPHWLASRGQFDKAEVALSWLRGWTTPENVADEFNTLKKTYPKAQAYQENRTCIERACCPRLPLKSYFTRSFCLPLTCIFLMFVIHASVGYYVLFTYNMIIFQMINSPIEPNVASTIFDAARIIGAIVCIFTVNRIGKKKLMSITLAASGLAYFIIGISLFFLKKNEFSLIICSWIATIMLLISTFITSAGIDKVVFMMNAEIFPTRYRNLGAGIGLFISTSSASVTNKIFLSTVEVITIQGMFIVFGSMSMLSIVIFHFLFPETEGRTLKEIEDHYSGVQKISKIEISKNEIENQ